MLVSEIMTAPAYGLPIGTSLETAIQLLARAHVSSVPIIDDQGRVVGIVSEGDILQVRIEPDARAHLRSVSAPDQAWPTLVDEVMTPDPATVQRGSDVADVGRLLAEKRWKSLPVADDGVLVGIVSRSDILSAFTTTDASICSRLTHDFAAEGYDGWKVSAAAGVIAISGTEGDREARIAKAMAAAVPGVRRVKVTDVSD